MELRQQTQEIKQMMLQLKHRYEKEEPPEDKKDKPFFNMVKQETAPWFELIGKWEEAARDFVRQREVKVHPQQVNATEENLHLLILHSYYIDIKPAKYMDYYQSIIYVLDLLLDDIEAGTKQ